MNNFRVNLKLMHGWFILMTCLVSCTDKEYEPTELVERHFELREKCMSSDILKGLFIKAEYLAPDLIVAREILRMKDPTMQHLAVSLIEQRKSSHFIITVNSTLDGKNSVLENSLERELRNGEIELKFNSIQKGIKPSLVQQERHGTDQLRFNMIFPLSIPKEDFKIHLINHPDFEGLEFRANEINSLPKLKTADA